MRAPQQQQRLLTGQLTPRRSSVTPPDTAALESRPRSWAGSPAWPRDGGFDIILSSGFLSFASHCGFLQAVEEARLPVRGVMGTSAGALTGSLYCAGFTPAQIADEFRRVAPIERVRLEYIPWQGLMSLDPAADILRALLPPRFEDLQRDFAVGVVSSRRSGRAHELLDRGALAEAVVASAAVPVLFTPVHVPGARRGPYIDGGVRCRIGLDLWRRHRYGPGVRPSPAVVHLIGRSSPFSGNDDVSSFGAQAATVVHSEKSSSSLWDISGFDEQFEAARSRALPVMLELARTSNRLRRPHPRAAASGG